MRGLGQGEREGREGERGRERERNNCAVDFKYLIVML